MRPAITALDAWNRGEFRELNTLLEEAYFKERTLLIENDPTLESMKRRLLDGGRDRVTAVLADSIGLPTGDDAYELLGLVGFFMAACRRHEIAMPDGGDSSPLTEASALTMRLGIELGVAPRFVSGHQAFFNRAVAGRYRSFTLLEDEVVFLSHNGLGSIAYQQAGESLKRVARLGVSNPMATYVLREAKRALEDVLAFNRSLSERLSVERFFFNIRPYYKTYRVGSVDYRGANAGDFAAINEIDLLLGLCSLDDPFYQDLVASKAPFMPPDDQEQLRRTARIEPLISRFLNELATDPSDALVENARVFIKVCRAHGEAYGYHHDRLVEGFLVAPAVSTPPQRRADLTASGPQLSAVVSGLERLRDLRAARNRPGLITAQALLARLESLLVSFGG